MEWNSNVTQYSGAFFFLVLTWSFSISVSNEYYASFAPLSMFSHRNMQAFTFQIQFHIAHRLCNNKKIEKKLEERCDPRIDRKSDCDGVWDWIIFRLLPDDWNAGCDLKYENLIPNINGLSIMTDFHVNKRRIVWINCASLYASLLQHHIKISSELLDHI